MRRRDAFLSALVLACSLAHDVPYRHRVGNQEGVRVEVSHVLLRRDHQRSSVRPIRAIFPEQLSGAERLLYGSPVALQARTKRRGHRAATDLDRCPAKRPAGAMSASPYGVLEAAVLLS